MNTNQTAKLLNMALFLLRQPQTPTQDVGRDLYDFAIEHTIDKNIKYQATSARELQFTRIGCILYLRHRLNLPLR